MKHNIGDKVRVKSLEWYNENKDKYGDVKCYDCQETDIKCQDTIYFITQMSEYCGKIVTIDKIWEDYYYSIIEDEQRFYWTDDMFEGLAEDTIQPVVFENIVFPNENYADKVELCLGDDYEVVVEDGRTFVQKKKPKYPTTYEECRKVLGIDEEMIVQGGWYKHSFICDFYKLLICRDAYWKIAGNWKPDYDNIYQEKWGAARGFSLPFPTKEILDTFNENFEDLVKKCENYYEGNNV